MVINGKEIAQKIINELKKQKRPDKILAAVLVDSAHSTSSGQAGSPQAAQSLSFIKQKEKIAQELGIKFQLYQFSETVSEEDLVKEIKKLGDDKKIGGIIIQLPLPAHFNRDRIISAINPQKDIDTLTSESKKYVLPPSVEVVKDILGIMNQELRIMAVAIVGAKGFLIGKPISEWLKRSRETGSFARPDLQNKSGLGLKEKCKKLILVDIGDDFSQIKEADLVISGVGKAGLIKPEMLKAGSAVIDFGYDVENGKIKGDFDTQLPITNYQLLNFYTPVPGGTGPILVAELFKNFYKLNKSPA